MKTANARQRTRREAGFTLPEVIVGSALLSLTSTFGYGVMLTANKQAELNRISLLAQETARNQIDRIQSVSPYNPQLPPPAGPLVPTDLILDSARGGPAVQTVNMYVDPTRNVNLITATVTTSITDAGNYNTRAALVTVTYNYRGKLYTVRMNTLRTSDS